ncbi:Uncharacterised protein [Zhongshania aliphaticivorans]|uniref:Imelysin-like domain-containing protein n=1 Tax=Zhongshania aliphaticivorans TaxID=1470434 RepID=A0A5S9NBM3_9GAMM|nr:imelysin family protein [Zhongshania aliphaticivorans]CAA0087558.1 Uncharacterised protein [Zhongshania aliphaticivorans]CAA0115108.1 Uncharacterised protein [Zhongshania aliphaticivorans]CAA0119949.1 Uncharacterised protein [Zhongshania aliphaticivorans]
MIFSAMNLLLSKPSKRAVMAGLSIIAVAACSPPPSSKILLDATASGIVDNYQSLSLASQSLATAAETFCQAPNDNSKYEQLQSHWKSTTERWSAVQNIQFGPLMIDNQAWKIQFWPDKKNLIARKVEALLKTEEPLTLERVDDASVVVQGLSSLEYLLFDSKAGQQTRYSEPQGQRRCELLVAVTSHLQAVANGLYNDWHAEGGNYLATFTSTGEKNPEFPDDNVAIAYLLDTLVSGIELIKRDKLENPLAITTSNNTQSRAPQTQIYQLEWWRSQYSKEAIIINLKTLEHIFNGGEAYGIDDYLNEAKQQGPLSEKIKQGFEKSIAAASAIDNSLFSIANIPEQRPSLLTLHNELAKLLALLRNELPAALGVSLGFNSKDGD